MEFVLIKRFGNVRVYQGVVDVEFEKFFILATLVEGKFTDLAAYTQQGGELTKIIDAASLRVIRLAIKEYIDDLVNIPPNKFRDSITDKQVK